MVLQAVIEILCAQWKQCDPLGILFHIVEKKLCIAVVTAIVMALRSLIKTESRTAKLRQVDSHCRGLTGKWTSEWMNQSLLFCSLPVCPFLILSFQVVCFWEKILQHDLACCLSIPCYLSSFEVRVLGWKAQTEFNLIFCVSSWNMFEYLFQSMQRRISCNTFSLRSIRTFWSSIWSSTVEVPFIFIDLCRFSRVDVPSSGPENVPKPGLPPFESPRSAVSSTCKEIITWDIRGTNAMEACALPSSLQAWLRNV